MAGAVTHLYVGLKTVSDKLSSVERFQYVLGNVFPDMEFLAARKLGAKEEHKTLKYIQSLPKEDQKKFKHFIKGLKSHLVVDHIIHGKFMDRFLKKLEKLDLGSNMTHVIIELALDVIVSEKYPFVKRYSNLSKKRFEELGFFYFIEKLSKFYKKDKVYTERLKRDGYKLLRMGLVNSWFKALRLWFILKKYFAYSKNKKRQKVTLKKMKLVFIEAKKLLEPEVDGLLAKLVKGVEKKIRWN